MKKYFIIILTGLNLLLTGCFSDESKIISEENKINEKNQQKIENISNEDLDAVVKAQESGDIKNCKKLEKEHLQKQCEHTIIANQKN